MLPAIISALCLLSAGPAVEPAEHLSARPGTEFELTAGTDPAMWVVDTGKAGIRFAQYRPSVASHGDECFVVWLDTKGDVYGIRADAQGALLDSAWRPICTGIRAQGRPDVSAGPNGYLAVWQDLRDGNFNIRAARIAFDGTVLDPDGFPVSAAPRDELYPRVTAGDSSWLVVWTDNRTGTNVFGARVAFDGALLDPAGIPIGVGTGTQTLPDAAWNGSHFLAVWKCDAQGHWVTRGARLNRAGEIIDPGGFFIAGDQRLNHVAGHARAASDGVDFMVVWQNEMDPYLIFASRVTADGLVPDRPVPLLPGQPRQEEPVVSFSHGRYLVAWQQQGNNWDIWCARLAPDGTVLDPAGTLVVQEPNEQHLPALTAVPQGWLAVWEDRRVASYAADVFAVGIDTLGTVLAPSKLVDPFIHMYTGQTVPAIAHGRDSYLLVWESRSGVHYPTQDADIYGIRLDRDGLPIEATAFSITRNFTSQYTPAVAAGDSCYLVAYRHQHHGLSLSRVTLDGQLLDPDGIRLGTPGETPAVAFGAGKFLVVWATGGNRSDIFGARVNENGEVLAQFSIMAGTDEMTRPAVAFDGENYLVAWQTGSYVKGTRVRPDGTVLDPTGLWLTSIQSGQPDIAFDGENYLVVHRTSYRCYGNRVSPGGVVLDSASVQLSRGGTPRQAPRVCFDGHHYLVAWQDGSRSGIRGSLVTPSLAVVDSFHLQPPTDWGLSSPAIACGPGGGLLVSSGRTAPGMPWDTLARIWAAPLSLPREDFRRPVTGGASGDTLSSGLPAGFAVRPAQFRRSVRLVVAAGMEVHGFRIYDAAGRCVRVLGREAREWNGRDDRDANLPAGVYLVETVGPGPVARRKVIKLE